MVRGLITRASCDGTWAPVSYMVIGSSIHKNAQEVNYGGETCHKVAQWYNNTEMTGGGRGACAIHINARHSSTGNSVMRRFVQPYGTSSIRSRGSVDRTGLNGIRPIGLSANDTVFAGFRLSISSA